jgi:RNA polymerase subunit RPABC4/transcription elongation factor Spt4
MAEKIVKIGEITVEGIKSIGVSKDTLENLRGKIAILKPEDSEIAKQLGIKEKGVYGARFR